MANFSDRVWWARQRSGLSYEKIEKQAKELFPHDDATISASSVSQIERRHSESSIFDYQLAKILKVPLTWLAYGDGAAPPEYSNKKAEQRLGTKKGRRGMKNKTEMYQSPSARKSGVVVPEGGIDDQELPAAVKGYLHQNALRKTLLDDFAKYCFTAGPDQARNLIKDFASAIEVVDGSARKNEVDPTQHRSGNP